MVHKIGKIEKLYQLGKTVFNIDDLRVIWSEQNADALKVSVKYFVDIGKLHRLKRGLYALVSKYDKFEVAQKLISPSYISLHTALQKHGIVFQNYSSISSFAAYNRTLTVEGQKYEYHFMKKNLLFNPAGIITEKNYTIASPERAICDFVYLYGLTYFDNLRLIDRGLITETAKIYGKKSVEKFIEKLIKNI